MIIWNEQKLIEKIRAAYATAIPVGEPAAVMRFVVEEVCYMIVKYAASTENKSDAPKNFEVVIDGGGGSMADFYPNRGS